MKKRRLSDSGFRKEADQIQSGCKKKVAKQWDMLSSVENPPNPLSHPQSRALDFQDVIYISPSLVGKRLEEVTYDLGVTTGYCGCQLAYEYGTIRLKRTLTRREWSEMGNSFLDGCRKKAVAKWSWDATQASSLPHRLPAPSPVTRPNFNPDLNWIPHPHGLGRLNFKGLAAAAAIVRQKVRDFGKEEGVLLRELER
ncbi:MAG: hypothetical protein M1826_001803 [Phylliscum demangeonii]|nr:MAG: hypothetical protein M1826_001803 [Phylliscum demangeonii]